MWFLSYLYGMLSMGIIWLGYTLGMPLFLTILMAGGLIIPAWACHQGFTLLPYQIRPKQKRKRRNTRSKELP